MEHRSTNTTMKQVAAYAGVSTATVARFIHKNGYISAEAEEKVKEGYSIALKANELDPANALTYEALGSYYAYRRDLAQAISTLQKGIALDRQVLVTQKKVPHAKKQHRTPNLWRARIEGQGLLRIPDRFLRFPTDETRQGQAIVER